MPASRVAFAKRTERIITIVPKYSNDSIEFLASSTIALSSAMVGDTYLKSLTVKLDENTKEALLLVRIAGERYFIKIKEAQNKMEGDLLFADLEYEYTNDLELSKIMFNLNDNNPEFVVNDQFFSTSQKRTKERNGLYIADTTTVLNFLIGSATVDDLFAAAQEVEKEKSIKEKVKVLELELELSKQLNNHYEKIIEQQKEITEDKCEKLQQDLRDNINSQDILNDKLMNHRELINEVLLTLDKASFGVRRTSIKKVIDLINKAKIDG